MTVWPHIDPRVEYVGVSRLRGFNSLGNLVGPVVIQDNGKPLAVLVGYEQYIQLQNAALDLGESGKED